MMNEVRIHTFTDTEIPYTEEQLFNKLCNMYKNTPIKNISSLWFHTYYTFMNCLKENLEDAYNENGNNREELKNELIKGNSNLCFGKECMHAKPALTENLC